MKDEHKEHLYIIGAVASIGAAAYLIMLARRAKVAKNPAPGPAEASDLLAISTPIPIYSFANIGGSNAPNGSSVGHNIGNSSTTDVPVGGQIQYSIITDQYQGL